jgi:hypothetical protein
MPGLFGFQGGVGGGSGGAGTPGTNGATWLNGAIDPAAGIGTNGDYYINTASYDIFQKQSGVWAKIGNLKGAAGATGPGVPVGGTAGQILSKKSATDYDTQWIVASTGGGSTDGWNSVNATLTYASATTINSSADLTGIIPRCAKFRWKQGGDYKFAYLVNITSNLWTILAGSDYSVANATITDAAWSVSDPAIGFPKVFNFTPTVTSFSGSFTSLGTCLFPFFIANNRVYFDINISIVTNGTAAGDVETTLPLPIAGATDIFAGGREWVVSGRLLTGRLVRSMQRLLISNSDATYPGGNGYSLILSGSYPI